MNSADNSAPRGSAPDPQPDDVGATTDPTTPGSPTKAKGGPGPTGASTAAGTAAASSAHVRATKVGKAQVRQEARPARPASARRAVRLSVFVVVALVAVLGAALLGSRSGGGQAEAADVVRQDSHRLGAPGSSGVTLTEFLDFECEACRAAYPLVEQLRQDYAGRVTFVVRYFPIPGHANSTPAAVAVQAASEQGQLEAMYQRMYQTQEQWGEQQQPTPEVFRAMAVELGLDMAAFDAAVADPATAARVASDFEDGIALGVQGTPTFFVNEEKIQPATEQEFRALLDQALAEAEGDNS
ncbi:hypothetical protein FMM08_19650 [Quadrisphaera setariae]|uniref:Thioredoxin domain-containing protein n=1 Tax=Quadrisphaera setariae TaxID=2593304 RepID=A0A5C8Z666_9ACTN|nr:hypothetical protein FHN55_18650 [Streptomyces sp. NP160]TXR52416.1 hypothetical protein FMM08_19650 [Quadrisphaera setariae]